MKRWQWISVALAMYDALAVNISYVLYLCIRYGGYLSIPESMRLGMLKFAPIYSLICVLIFFVFKMYQWIWEFVGMDELRWGIVAVFIVSVIHIVGISLFVDMPMIYFVYGFIFQFIFVLGIRFAKVLGKKVFKK